MSLRIVVLRHEPETGLGTFADLLDEAQVDYELVETLRSRCPMRVHSTAQSPWAAASTPTTRGFSRRAGGSATVYWAGCLSSASASAGSSW
ncbi:MAG: hypothetical protein ACRDOP_07655, partial [Gaiellaceae bacterium]